MSESEKKTRKSHPVRVQARKLETEDEALGADTNGVKQDVGWLDWPQTFDSVREAEKAVDEQASEDFEYRVLRCYGIRALVFQPKMVSR